MRGVRGSTGLGTLRIVVAGNVHRLCRGRVVRCLLLAACRGRAATFTELAFADTRVSCVAVCVEPAVTSEDAGHQSVPAMAPPTLTLPPREAQAVRDAYEQASVFLEYGSGGSTVLAASGAQRTVFSVESDAAWADGLRLYFEQNPPKGRVRLHSVNIGETAAWGKPVNDEGWRGYYHYPISVWDRPDFEAPDVILIDGRFRTACFVTALLRIRRGTVILWDDYTKRKAYHEVERWLKPVSLHGRLARFEAEPVTLDAGELSWMMKQFTRPF